jgi:benzoyl-CoA reductase subunit D
MTLAAGIDLGTGAVKTVLFDVSDGETKWLARNVSRIRRRDPMVLARQGYENMLSDLDLDPELVDYVATTGDGESIPFRTGHFYSMTTHARGATYLQPGINAVIDIGALHGRAISTDERGKVLTYKMTSQCASGSGQFLSRGISTANILKGIHIAMASRLVKLLKSIKAREGTVLLTGGLATDEGLVEAMKEQAVEQKLKVDILNHTDSIFAGAIGAALWGAFRHDKLLQAEHGVPSSDLEAYDKARPVLAVDLGQEEVTCPISSVAEPTSSACPADQVLDKDIKEKGA